MLSRLHAAAAGLKRLRFSVPKGFGKFYPKGTASGPAGKTAGAAGEAGAKAKPKVSFGGGGGGGGGGRKPGDGQDGQWRNLVLGGGAVVALFFLLSSDVKSGHEISWQEFQSQLLETGQVDRIIVTNKNVARVVVRRSLDGLGEIPGADGIGGINNSSSSLSSSSLASSPQQFQHPDEGAATSSSGWRADLPSPDGGASTGMSTGGGVDPNKFARYPRIGAPVPSFAPYYFSIGSVETFERKLEEAQRRLNVNPRDYIPVMYVNETSWTQEAMRFAPTLLLIGAYFALMRGASGGMGGGASNVFKIGKTTAKKIAPENVSVTFKDVAGCDEAKREIMVRFLVFFPPLPLHCFSSFVSSFFTLRSSIHKLITTQ